MNEEDNKPKNIKTWICSLCAGEEGQPVIFTDETSYREHKKRHLEGLPIPKPKAKSEAPDQKAAAAEEPKPETKREVELHYRYEGNCGNCGARVETLIVDLDKRKSNYVAVAFCTGCKKQLKQKEVARL